MKFFKFLILNFNAQFSRSHFPNKLEHADKKAEYLCTEKTNYIVSVVNFVTCLKSIRHLYKQMNRRVFRTQSIICDGAFLW